ncbi:cellulose biosynthesis cyclic di-GMP-binding regulatory protein BcsB [Nocardia altamirensis]|uniref:cellulose biosynthesis cyclic di-GMP-binding regulatory protein BcsB n=1 Tax=Nocardia altamirensis TaxID=472158 RepID=UPI000A52A87A|nr:cellulose biosynthesis cyclic di-GMP-binding regulatory protein BcsB [Nocardia altamirensis]
MTLRVQFGRRLRRVGMRIGAVGAVAVLAVGPMAASAAPGEVTLGLKTLGLGKSLTFPGAAHEVSLTLPLLPGLVPTAIVGTVQLPPHVGRGAMEVHSGERLLDRVEIPVAPRAPIRLGLAGAEVVDNAISVTLASSLISDAGFCVTDWLGRPLALTEVGVVYSGEEVQPTTVADFLPPVLQRLTIYLPADPAEVESAAAMTLSAAVIARYGSQPVTVAVRPIPASGEIPDDPLDLLERQVVIGESPNPGLRLSPGPKPRLTINGEKKSLPDQMRLLVSDLTKVAISSAATAVALPQAPIIAPERTTLGELGQTQLTSTALGAVRVDVGIDQSRLGRPSKDVRVRLHGSYTPLPNTLNGQLTVTAGDIHIDSWPVDASGRFDRWISVPNSVLGRFTTLSVTFHQAGLTHGCGLEQPLTLTIDPSSEVTSNAANPPIPSGFGALPQALLPDVQVGLRTPGFADTARAVTVLTGLQRLTAIPMRPELVPFDQAVQSKTPAVLIAANGDVPESIRLPLTQTDAGLALTDTEGKPITRITIDPTTPFASLQSTWSGGRTVVVGTSSNAPEHFNRILEWLDADLDRWSRLHGSVLFQADNRAPEFVDTDTMATPAPSTAEMDTVARILTAAGAAVVLVGVLVGIGILVRRGRR